MIEDMTIRNLSRATQQSYIYAVAKFSRHFNLSPDRLGMEEIRAYQLHLVEEKHSWSHINQVTCALRLFLRHHLGAKGGLRADRFSARSPRSSRLFSMRRARFLPRSRHRIAQPRRADDRLRGRLASWRRPARLKVASIDSERMLILIENGKGGKDRYAMLSPRLPRHPPRLLAARPARPVAVPGQDPWRSRQPGHVAGGLPDCSAASWAAQARHRPCAAAQFSPRISWRAASTSAVIQVLLGHADLSSTTRYAQVATNLIASTPTAVRSPLALR
jgi:integrase